MQNSTNLLQIIWKKYRSQAILAYLFFLFASVGLSMFSPKWLQNWSMQEFVRPVHAGESQQALNVNVYDNYGAEGESFQAKIIESIDSAEEEILIAMYAFNLESIRSALAEAAQRGVRVELLYEASKGPDMEDFMRDYKDLINIEYAGMNREGNEHYLMHHKYAIFDPDTQNEVLMTGTWNWSAYQEDLDPNILLEIRNEEIIQAYHDEFKRLKSGKFGRKKYLDWSYSPWMEKISFVDGSIVEIWFSPGRLKHSVQDRVVDLIYEAEEQIDIGMTILDSYTITSALLNQARNGVKIRLIVDRLTADLDDSSYQYLLKSISKQNLEDNFQLLLGGEENVTELGEYSIFHHHNMIIDGETVLTGTANWTYNGFFISDENFLIIRNPEIAAKFTNFFESYLESL